MDEQWDLLSELQKELYCLRIMMYTALSLLLKHPSVHCNFALNERLARIKHLEKQLWSALQF